MARLKCQIFAEKKLLEQRAAARMRFEFPARVLDASIEVVCRDAVFHLLALGEWGARSPGW